MRLIQVAGLFILIALGGCRTSDRTITLEDSQLGIEGHRFIADFAPITFSPDGLLMAGMGSTENRFEVRDVGTGDLVSQFRADWSKGFPVLFSADGKSLVILNQDEEDFESFTVSVFGGELVKLHEATDNEGSPTGWNYDFTVFAMSDGAVLLNDGRFVVAEGVEGPPYFDQYGTVWYRANPGWVSVGRDGEVTKHEERPSYLVENQLIHRGSMHLFEEEVTLTRNEASAYVTAVWMDHDKAAPMSRSGEVVYDQTALVYSGADVYSFTFVPNRKMVAVSTNQGTAFVPYVVEPRGEEEEKSDQ